MTRSRWSARRHAFRFKVTVLSRRCPVVLAIALIPALAAGQDVSADPPAPAAYTPPTSRDRVNWVVQGALSLPVVVFNTGDALVSTAANWPKEWGRGGSGFSKRLADEEAYSAMSGALEAGAGTLWGEDPRYLRSDRPDAWGRVRHTLVATVLTARRDGHLAPAWAHFAAEAGAIPIQNAWLPPSARTPGAMAWRVGEDLMFRALSNMWDEFWPDVRKRLPAPLK